MSGEVDTNSILYQIGQAVKNASATGGVESDYVDEQILELKAELTNVDAYSPAVDTEYRNLNRTLLGNKAITVTIGDIETITNLGDEVFVYRNENGIFRYLSYNDQVGQGGRDVYKRVDSDGNEITAPIGDEYDVTKSRIGTKSYPYDGQYPLIEIVKTGDYAVGWMDVQDISDRVSVLESGGGGGGGGSVIDGGTAVIVQGTFTELDGGGADL